MSSSTARVHGQQLQQDAAPLAKAGKDAPADDKKKRRKRCFVCVCLGAIVLLAIIIVAAISMGSGPRSEPAVQPTGAIVDMRFQFAATNGSAAPSASHWAGVVAESLSLPAARVSCEATLDAGQDVLDCGVSILNDDEARSVLVAIGEDPDDYAQPSQFIAPMGIISAIETAPAAFWSGVAASQGTAVTVNVVSVATLVELAHDWYPKTDYGEPDSIAEFNGNWYLDFRPAAGEPTRLGRLDPATMPACPVVVNETVRSPDDMTSCHGRLYFRAYSSVLDVGKEIFEHDPATGRTELVVDLMAGSASSNFGGDGMACVGEYLLFNGDNGTTGEEPWLLHTSTGAVSLLSDIQPGSDDSSPTYITAVNDMVACFRASSPAEGVEPWCFNATTETLAAYDVRVGSSSSTPSEPFVAASSRYLVFKANDGTDKGLWVIDTVLGTAERFLNDYSTTRKGIMSALIAIDDLIFASMNHDVTGGTWHGPGMINMSDPSPHPVILFDPEPGDFAGTTAKAFALDGDVLYVGLEHADELWIMDLRNMSVTASVDVTPNDQGAFTGLFILDHTVMLVAEHPIADVSLLYYSPGSNHTVLACDVDPWPDSGSGQSLTLINDTLWWSGSTLSQGTEGWRRNLTSGITEFLGDIRPGTPGGSPRYFTEYRGQVYFAARAASTDNLYRYKIGSGVELVDSTMPVKGPIVALGDKLFFSCDTPANGVEVCAFNGSTTQLVADLNEGSGHSYPQNLAVAKWMGVDILVGSYYTFATGREPFVMTPDGSSTSTMDLNPGGGSSSPSDFTNFNGELCFVSTTVDYGREVTCQGLVKDVRGGSESSWPYLLVPDGDFLFFASDFDGNGDGLVRMNMSEANMTLALDIARTGDGERVGYIQSMCKLGHTLFMATSSRFLRMTLPGLVAEVVPGIDFDSSPDGMVCGEDRVFLLAEDDGSSHTPYGTALYEYVPTGDY